MKNYWDKPIKISTPLGWAIASLVFLGGLLLIFVIYRSILSGLSFPPSYPQVTPLVSSIPQAGAKGLVRFASADEFRRYLEDGAAEYTDTYSKFGLSLPVPVALPNVLRGMEEGTAAEDVPERISETTVQVPGIDEPDIVKTDGKEIYFSSGYVWRTTEILPRCLPGEKCIDVYPYPTGGTSVIKAFPPADLKIDSRIDLGGDLLLAKNMLVVSAGQNIYGYNIANPLAPEKKWEVKLQSGNTVAASRLYQNKIYLVTKTTVNLTRPCPIPLFQIGSRPIDIDCTAIHHPVNPIPADVTFTASILDPATGNIEKTVSFIGSSGSSVVYMSENAIYITYSYNASMFRFFSGFMKEKAAGLVPDWLIQKIEKTESYDISPAAKMVEFENLWQQYENSLSDDDRLKVRNEMTNRIADYYKGHKRDLEKTGIIKIGLGSFAVAATGEVPGYPLNQFALDEYQGNLRAAITVGERSGFGFMFGMGGRAESASDVYVLDGDLKILGSVRDLGLTERIYSVRFVGDKGYVVTFRQTDPFYVMDLSDPKKPELKGELKIPGYSSYLHPIAKNRILGVGMENSRVKISVFDVSLAQNPQEISKYNLDEYWSDILNTHHAFLQDPKHEIFFLPGSKGGYIFSYKNDKLEMFKAVSGISARRALYLSDYLYIVGDNKITVLNEADWQKVNELDLGGSSRINPFLPAPMPE